jgi:hypothetical protein
LRSVPAASTAAEPRQFVARFIIGLHYCSRQVRRRWPSKLAATQTTIALRAQKQNPAAAGSVSDCSRLLAVEQDSQDLVAPHWRTIQCQFNTLAQFFDIPQEIVQYQVRSGEIAIALEGRRLSNECQCTQQPGRN